MSNKPAHHGITGMTWIVMAFASGACAESPYADVLATDFEGRVSSITTLGHYSEVDTAIVLGLAGLGEVATTSGFTRRCCPSNWAVAATESSTQQPDPPRCPYPRSRGERARSHSRNAAIDSGGSSGGYTSPNTGDSMRSGRKFR